MRRRLAWTPPTKARSAGQGPAPDSPTANHSGESGATASRPATAIPAPGRDSLVPAEGESNLAAGRGLPPRSTRAASQTGVRTAAASRPFDSPEALASALRGAAYIADEGLEHRRFPRARAGQTAAARRRARNGQDRGGQGARGGARPRPRPASVLRRHGLLRCALRVELSRADAGASPQRRAERRPLRRVLPDRAPVARRAARARPHPAPRRRDRPLRSRVRGLPARVSVRFPDLDPGDRHAARRVSSRRGAHLEPHPRAARGVAPPLRVRLDRLPRAGEGSRDREPSCAGRERCAPHERWSPR